MVNVLAPILRTALKSPTKKLQTVVHNKSFKNTLGIQTSTAASNTYGTIWAFSRSYFGHGGNKIPEEHFDPSAEPQPVGKAVHPPGAPRKPIRSELYGFKIYNSEGPLDHVISDGRVTGGTKIYSTPLRDQQPQKFTRVNGETYIVGVKPLPIYETHWDAIRNTKWYRGVFNNPVLTKSRMKCYTNYDFIMKTDYCMFWLPTFIVFSISIPTYCMAYVTDELAYTSMTVKVIGRQWYWVYEVESPADEDEDEDEDEEVEDEKDEEGEIDDEAVASGDNETEDADQETDEDDD